MGNLSSVCKSLTGAELLSWLVPVTAMEGSGYKPELM